MSWERDALWAKSKLYFERAFSCPREAPTFGLWCALGLELLARSAVASVSPTLLAEPDRDHLYLLHALGKGSSTVNPKSIGAVEVIRLCQTLFNKFTVDDLTTAKALFNRRNAELHTGAAAFEEYTTQQWITGLYQCCRSLCDSMGEPLEALMGDSEAEIAKQVLDDAKSEEQSKVKGLIAAHKKVFHSYDEDRRHQLLDEAGKAASKLAFQRHHRVTCPACGGPATVQGTTFGLVTINHSEDEVVTSQAVLPTAFECISCGLRLASYGELKAAGLGDQYTRTSKYSPEDYFGLLDPADTYSMREYVDRHLDENPDIIEEHLRQFAAEEYDNE